MIWLSTLFRQALLFFWKKSHIYTISPRQRLSVRTAHPTFGVQVIGAHGAPYGFVQVVGAHGAPSVGWAVRTGMTVNQPPGTA